MHSYCYVYVFLLFVCSVLYICFHRVNRHSPIAMTEIFPCFFLSCKANARVHLAQTGHSPHSSKLLNCVVLRIVCVDCVVLYIVCV
jgi:hypothetical protein